MRPLLHFTGDRHGRGYAETRVSALQWSVGAFYGRVAALQATKVKRNANFSEELTFLHAMGPVLL